MTQSEIKSRISNTAFLLDYTRYRLEEDEKKVKRWKELLVDFEEELHDLNKLLDKDDQ